MGCTGKRIMVILKGKIRDEIMKTELEAGYLMQLFNDPIYLMGYEPAVVEIAERQEKREEAVKEMPGEEIKVIPKLEPKSIPTTPKLQPIVQKIAKKCILLYLSQDEELTEKEMVFLSKVMGAAKVQQEEYECINFTGITINDIASRYTFDKLILFGVAIPNLSLSPYKCTQVKSTKIIAADAIWMVEANVGLKKQLWDQMQIMFGLV
jgi:DNA polymerase III psi subunit